MDSTVVIYMQAYNAERTLRRALDSLEHQTYSDWKICLINNGSTDRTGEIAREYAERDSRIIYKRLTKNDYWYYYTFIIEYIKKPLGSYFAWLDADDEYKPNFIENAMQYIKKYRLDCCIGGTDYIDSISGEVQFVKKPETDLIISGTDFPEKFTEYRRFIDVMWGKVFSLSLIQSVDYTKMPRTRFATDSIIILEMLRQCYIFGGKIGFLSHSLHKYYRSPGTLTQYFHLDFAYDIHVYFDMLKTYLFTFGEISAMNTDYLYAIWLGWIQDGFAGICNSNALLRDRLNTLEVMISSPITKKMLNRKADSLFRNLGQRDDFCKNVLQWISMYSNDPENADVVRKIMVTLERE